MRHGSSKRKFHRTSKLRDSLMRGLASSLIQHSRITTTREKAKELRPYVEKLITKGKTISLATTKILMSRLPKISAAKLVKEVAPKFANRNGGYTRIRLLPQRASDGAHMAIIEFVD